MSACFILFSVSIPPSCYRLFRPSTSSFLSGKCFRFNPAFGLQALPTVYRDGDTYNSINSFNPAFGLQALPTLIGVSQSLYWTLMFQSRIRATGSSDEGKNKDYNTFTNVSIPHSGYRLFRPLTI